MKHLGSKELFDSEFLRNFSQLENIFKKHLKSRDSMKKLISYFNNDPDPKLDTNFFTNEDMNRFDMAKVEKDKYYVNLQKDQIKTSADFEFFLISSTKIKYFYVTSEISPNQPTKLPEKFAVFKGNINFDVRSYIIADYDSDQQSSISDDAISLCKVGSIINDEYLKEFGFADRCVCRKGKCTNCKCANSDRNCNFKCHNEQNNNCENKNKKFKPNDA